MVWLFEMFFGKIWPCLHLVANPLYLTMTVTCLAPGECYSLGWMLWKGFSLTMERILWSSTTVVLHGRPGLFMLLSSLVCSFFSECTKLLIWPFIMIQLSPFWFWSLKMACFTCMERSFDWMMWVQSDSFQKQMSHLESTQEHLPA